MVSTVKKCLLTMIIKIKKHKWKYKPENTTRRFKSNQ